jgi:hypothetical protein
LRAYCTSHGAHARAERRSARRLQS